MQPISDLNNCTNPSGNDFIPILDIDGGIAGRPKTKKVKLSAISAFTAQSVTGIVRTTTQAVTSGILGFNQSEDIILPLCKTFILINVAVNIPGRIRLYTSPIYREADRERSFEVDPLEDSGVFFEGQFDSTLLSFPISPLEIIATEDSDSPAIFDSRSLMPQKAIITFTYLPLEI